MKFYFTNTHDFSNDPRPLLSRMWRHYKLELLTLLGMLRRRWIVGTGHNL